MSVERDRPPPAPEVEDGRVPLLRRLATVAGRESVADEALSGRGGDAGREYLDLLGRSMMMRSSESLARTTGRPFEPPGPRDAVIDRRIQDYARTMESLSTVRGRDRLAGEMAAGGGDPSSEAGRRLQALRQPEGRDEQLRQARDYAAFYKVPFEAVQPGERLTQGGVGGPSVRDRESLLGAMATAQGRRDLVLEARAKETVPLGSSASASVDTGPILADLRDPTHRAIVFSEARDLARAKGRAFEPLERDAAFHQGGDRARGEVLSGLASRHGRESLMQEAVAWGHPMPRADLSEATGYETERHRLVRGLSAPETRQPILGEAEAYAKHRGVAFEPIRGDEEIAVRDRFNPAMGQGRTAELEVGGAGNFSRDRIAAMVGRIDGDLSKSAGLPRGLGQDRGGFELS